MRMATHIIKIRGTFDENIWKEKKELRDYVDCKIKNEIDLTWHPDLELFKVDENKIEVWVYIHASSCNIKRNIIERWMQDHIKEEGITVDGFEIDIIDKGYKENKFFVLIP